MTDPNAQPQQPQGQPPQQPPQGGYQQPPQGGYQQPPQGGYQQPAPGAPLTPDQDKLWASLAHFGGILWLLPSLIIWLVFKDRGQRTAVEGKEALNWQINFVGGWIILWILTIILGAIFLVVPALWALLGLLWLLPFAWWIINVILSIMGGVKVNQGGSYRYPLMMIRFIK